MVDHCQSEENRKERKFRQLTYCKVEFFAQAFDYVGEKISNGLKKDATLISVMPNRSLRKPFQFFGSVKAVVDTESPFGQNMVEKYDTETGRRRL